MGSIILTGISHGKHQFSLTYPEVDGVVICMAHCKCGYEVEIINFRSYGGGKDLQMKWEKHIETWKGWNQRLIKCLFNRATFGHDFIEIFPSYVV